MLEIFERTLFLTILVIVSNYLCNAYKTGAPTLSCNTMVPGHGYPTQTSSPPYNVSVVSPDLGNGRLRIRLASINSNTYFTGFLLRDKLVPSNGEGGSSLHGTFTAVPQDASIFDCGGSKSSAVTHKSDSKKRSVEVDYQPPKNFDGSIVFRSTFVYNYSVFWVGVESLPIQTGGRNARQFPPSSSFNVNNNDPQINSAIFSVYSGCGQTKNCLSHPENCLNSKSCDAVVAVTSGSSEYEIEMYAKQAKYVAVGFSDDEAMGGDYVFECVNEGNTVRAHHSWNEPRRKANTRLEDTDDFNLINGLLADGIVYCKIRINSVVQYTDRRLDLNNEQYYLFLAAGSETSRRGPGVGYHDLFQTRSKVRRYLSDVTADPLQDSFYNGCNTVKTCFGVPEDCVERQNCNVVTTVAVQGNRFLINMQAKSAAYVATGLSEDQQMGDDIVFECVREDASGSNIKAFMSYNLPGQKANERLPRQNNLILQNYSYTDGKIQCAIQLDVPTFNVRGKSFNLATEKYFLLLAAGKTVTPSGQGSIGRVGYHDIFRGATDERRALADVSAIRGASKLLLHLHGSFMIASWIGLASLGIVLARYYKQTWVGSSCCGKDPWFFWHRFSMFLVVVLTIAGVVLIYIYSDGIVTGPGETHALLGFITAILAFLQPIGAMFRPHPDSSRRPIFNWLHWLVGNSAHVIAIVTIFFAVDLGKAELPKWTDWILVTFVAYYVLVHLILSISGCMADKSGSMRINSMQMKDMNTSRNIPQQYERRKDAPQSCMRKFIILLHFLIILAFSVFLILLVVYAPVKLS